MTHRDAARIAARFGGVRYRLQSVECRRAVTGYLSFRVYGDCRVTIQPPGGHALAVKLFGSIVEMGDRYKIIGILAD